MLCCDENSHVQALERTQPGLPLGIGHIQKKPMITRTTARLRYSQR